MLISLTFQTHSLTISLLSFSYFSLQDIEGYIVKNLSLIACALTLVPTLAFAGPSEDHVKALVKQRLHMEATSVKALPVGLYEVVTSNQSLLYVDKDVKFLVAGHIFDVATQKDLTQTRLDELSRIDVSILPLDQAIKTVHGKGERNLYVFADPYCGYCQRLEKTLKSLDNVTIYTFVTPLLNSDAMVDRILCAPNPAQAWDNWMLENKEPPALDAKCKITTGKKNYELFERLGLEGAPCMYFDDGNRLEGAASIEEIETRFKNLKK